MERQATPRAGQSKGVEFSDHLTVFGPPSYGSTTDTNPSYGPSSALPKGRVFVHRGAVANQEMASDPYSDHPQHPRSLSEHFDHTPIDEERPLSNTPSLVERWERDSSSEGYAFTNVLSSQYGAETYIDEFHGSYDNLNFRAASGKRRGRVFIDNPVKYTVSGYPDDEQVETCTDSDVSGGDQATVTGPIVATSPTTFQRVISDECFEESTRINTKLNSMPSGGAFSLMNSSEDITASRGSSQSSTDDDDTRSSRKMVRVDGSAKLSSASGMADDDDFGDEFGIEGAEAVDEEEDVQVKSFGRSFAKVCLRDGEDVIIRDPRVKKRQSEVAFSLESDIRRGSSLEEEVEPKSSPAELFTDDDEDTYQGMFNSKSSPPRRRSKVRITFNKGTAKGRTSKTSVHESSDRRVSRKESRRLEEPDAVMVVDESDQEFNGITCFPARRLNSRTNKSRVKSNTTELGPSPGHGRFTDVETAKKVGIRRYGTSHAIVNAISQSELDGAEGHREAKEPREKKKSRQMVKNVSLQRDDWIEFATSGSSRQKSPWVRRLLSSNGDSPTVSPAKRSSAAATATTVTTPPKEAKRTKGLSRRRSLRSFWRRWIRRS